MQQNSFKPRKSIRTTQCKMYSSTLINAVLLCLLNASFMVIGIILNSVVIISLWRSSQLRKKLCYFMIIVLSCFDLAIVTIVQPLLMLSTILWSMKIYHAEIQNTRFFTCLLLEGFSMFALLTLNIERFLALTRPFFHQTIVTKGKLTLFLALPIIIIVALSLLCVIYSKARVYLPVIIAVYLLSFWFVLAFLNYKMLVIVKSKHKDELRVAPASLETSGNQERQKRQKRNLKNISTCSLAVGCFLITSFPVIINSILRFVSNSPKNDRQGMLFSIWATIFVSMNSTFNSVIFFWRNSILRREGMKIVKCLFRTERS